MKANTSTKQATNPPAARVAKVPPEALAALQQRADTAASLLKAMANADRLLLLCRLVDAEQSVTALGEATGIGQPSLSQQLGVLRNEGLVATRREGRCIHYRIATPAVAAVLRTLYEQFCINRGDAVH